MKHIKEIQLMNTEKCYNDNTMNTAEANPSKDLITAILSMFTEWKTWFANKLKASDWQMDRAMIWANYLTAKQITRNEFMQAKTQVLDLDFPPNNPKEFLDLARKIDFGDCYQAYTKATHGKYATAISYETASRIGFYEIRTQAEKQIYPIWEKTYQQVCDDVKNGAVFSLPEHKQIEAPTEQVASQAEALSHIEKIKAMLANKRVA